MIMLLILKRILISFVKKMDGEKVHLQHLSEQCSMGWKANAKEVSRKTNASDIRLGRVECSADN